ncbi:hypothetical protein RIF23_05460 [Lipingzhangella sp. LS1_29]|uniref:Transferase n=1 Tax=Lipingzhangella rawalii TaxID=2055835 RepID=A0ABU2H360_9ACTN|nr:hypothetical protein [Lipingzhangella rawalii]
MTRRRISPNRLAVLGVTLLVLAAVWLSAGDLLGRVVAAALVLLVLVVNVATREHPAGPQPPRDFAPTLMRIGEGVLYAGMALGGTAAGVAGMWVWATVALAVLAARCVLVASHAAPPDRSPGPAAVRSPVTEGDPSRASAGQEHDPVLAARILGDSSSTSGRGLGRRGADRAAADEAPNPHPGGGARFGWPFGQQQRLAVICGTLLLPEERVTFLALAVLGGISVLTHLRPTAGLVSPALSQRPGGEP